MAQFLVSTDRRGPRASVFFSLLLALLGCGEPEIPAPEGARQGELWRWIADDPRQRFDPTERVDATLFGEARRVELGHTVQPARLARLGAPLAWPLPAELDGELRFAVGLPPGSTKEDRAPVRVRVLDRRGDGERVLLDHSLDHHSLDHSLDPGDGEAGRWHELRVALPSAPAGRLIFEASGPGEAGSVFWGDPTLYPAAFASAAPGDRAATNLVLVSVDTWRADRLSLYGYPRPTTPWLDIWAGRRAVVFENAVAAAPWTLPSHVSMLSGIGPLGHRVHHDIASRRGEGLPELLAERLRRAGWSSLAITGGAYLHPEFGFDRGFDTYAYWADRGRSHRELRSGVDRSLEWLAERGDGEPFFLFLHTYAAHDPYRARQPHFRRWAPDDDWPRGASVALDALPRQPPAMRKESYFVRRHRGEREPLELPAEQGLLDALYDSGLAHVDQQLARLLRGLDELGLRSSTLVVLTSDHGEALGDRGGDAGHETLYDHTLRVPLALAFPDRRGAGLRIAPMVRSIDLVPTVLAALGLDPADEGIEGRSLLPMLEAVGVEPGSEAPPPAWSYAAAPNHGLSLRLENRFKAIFDTNAWRPGGERRIELYDLERDPAERHDLLAGPAADSALAETWYRRFAEAWNAGVEGLRLRLQNPGPGRLEGELEGEMIRAVATKSIDLDCSCLEWVEPGKARFRLAAGDGFTLHFEKVFGRRLEVRGVLLEQELRHRFSTTLSTERPSGLAWDGTTWRSATRDTLADAPGLVLDWVGEPRHDEAGEEDNETLRRQLEALGYL